jgi:hypothetical protein
MPARPGRSYQGVAMTGSRVRSRRQGRAERAVRSIGFAIAAIMAVAACGGTGAKSSPTSSTGSSVPTLPPFETPSPTPGATPDGTGLNEQLIAYLPSGGAGAKCENASDTAARAAVARVKCTYKATNQTVWFSQYQDPDEVAAAYSEQQVGTKTAGKGCEAARFHGEYTIDGAPTGQVACLKRGNDAWMVWTIDDASILGEAVRKGNTAKALFTWWRNNLPIGRTGVLKLTSTTPEPTEEPQPTAS